MKLDEVLAMAGEHQLSGFEWGVSVVILYNSLVASEHHIDASHSGKQAYEKMRRLPSTTLSSVLFHEVQVDGVNVKFIGTTREQSRNVPPTVPQQQRKMNPMAVFLMCVMTAISLMLGYSAIRTAHNGETPDTTALQMVLKTMVELVKEENRQPAQGQPPAQPQPDEGHSPP